MGLLLRGGPGRRDGSGRGGKGKRKIRGGKGEGRVSRARHQPGGHVTSRPGGGAVW